MAGKLFPVDIESHTTCGDVCGVIEGAFNIKHSANYTVYEVFGELGIQIVLHNFILYLFLQ